VKSKAAFAGLSAAALTFLLFLPALRFGFLQWDDAANILNNLHFRSFDLAALRWMWTTHYEGPYQPLSWMSLALDYKFWALRPFGFHLTNILLHTINVGLFTAVAYRFLYDEPRDNSIRFIGAFVAGLFFGIHPLRVESVVWVTERRDVLSGFFFLISFLTYLKLRNNTSVAPGACLPAGRVVGRGPAVDDKLLGPGLQPAGPTNFSPLVLYTIGLLAFTCAVLSKATAIGVLWAMLAYDFYHGRSVREAVVEKIPFFGVAILVAGINLSGFHSGALAVGSYGLLDRILISFHGIEFYFQKTFWPFLLGAYYELPKHLLFASAFGVRASIGLCLCAVVFLNRRRWPALWYLFAVYVLILLPVSGLAQNGQQIAADRYSYLSCMPWAIAVGWLFMWGRDRQPDATFMGVLFLFLTLGSLTKKQIAYWRADLPLWEHTVAVSPDSCLAHYNLGMSYDAQNRDREAVRQYQAAYQFCPNDVDAHMNAGALYDRHQAWPFSEREYLAALSIEPSKAEAQNNLALAEAHQGRWKAAIARLQKAADDHPAFAEARFNLGVLQTSYGQRAQGLDNIKKAIALTPALANRLPPLANDKKGVLRSTVIRRT
jgi:protein O-mannosyl-transferase